MATEHIINGHKITIQMTGGGLNEFEAIGPDGQHLTARGSSFESVDQSGYLTPDTHYMAEYAAEQWGLSAK